MSNSVSDDPVRPILTKIEAQPGVEAVIAAFVSELQQGTGGAASRYEIVRAFAISDDVIVAHVARYALNPEGHPIEPSSDTSGNSWMNREHTKLCFARSGATFLSYRQDFLLSREGPYV